jgi:hypothetical protein
VRFTIEGKDYEFDRKLTVEEAMVIQDKAKLGLNEFDPALLRGNPYALCALIYLGKRRAGEAVRFQDLMGLDLLTLTLHYDEPEQADVPGDESGGKPREGKQATPDPTSRSGKTRKAGTTGTSSLSD